MGRLHQIRRSAPVVGLAQFTKARLRTAGELTADRRCDPDFLIIGTKRGGTTSLYKYFLEHPAMLSTFPRPARVKGTYYFDEEYARGEDWYRSHFPLHATRTAAEQIRGHRMVSGEASPYYLYHPLAAGRASTTVPDVRIVALLRNPAERAFSHYKERRANDTEPIDTFDAALDAETERLDGEEQRLMSDPTATSAAHRHHSYVDQGRYIVGLRRWWEAFGRDAVLVERSEDFYADPQGTFDRICDHVGIIRHPLANPAVFNAQRSSPLDDQVRSRLEADLTPSVRELEDELGRSMDWF